ncbi:branched-chain amino acid ABC transporter permease [Cupriavidus sp. UYPR2.512]|uniref:branched-chain amino acid ABC transporter permease n=1 Tax=Cupriavidus sp. UYPR2.512 TaxID=1080187 RepID=UPI00036001B2|nr:branched-chain amino acid ABC transporter permease [Cupriavidus sp. UYPR2.512]UIF84740.1 branched-chain amino acid ABC transporter permease [Cupriavidus necator]
MKAWKLIVPAAIALIPLVLESSYWASVATEVMIVTIFAQSLNLLLGYAGLFAFGQAAFFSIGGYVLAILLTVFGTGHLVAIAGALFAACLAAAVFAIISLRTSGIPFVMITLALGQLVWSLAMRMVGVTGGENGMSGIPRPTLPFVDLTDPYVFYVLCVVIAAINAGWSALFIRAPLGAALRGTRDQPRRMSSLGFNVWGIRWLAFVVSGFWAGLAGVLFVYFQQYVSPNIASLDQSAEALLAVIIGGAATLVGPLVGAIVVVGAKSVIGMFFDRWPLVLGLIFIFVVVVTPEGLVVRAQMLRKRFGGAAKSHAATQAGEVGK